MPATLSPLRYPGGKSQMAPLVIEILRTNRLFRGHYVEPFAGGAGIACKLLLDGYVSHIHINDLDRAVFSFWKAILTEPDRFCRQIEEVDVSIAEWKRQRAVQADGRASTFTLGFSTFFLNRTNRSGIINGGVIGGLDQAGKYPLDCRFNRQGLIMKIQRIASRAQQITVTNREARAFLSEVSRRLPPDSLINIDPPYYKQGPELYRNSYRPTDHGRLASSIGRLKPLWIVTYDDLPETRRLYRRFACRPLDLNYSAQTKRLGVELLVLDPRLSLPSSLLMPKAA